MDSLRNLSTSLPRTTTSSPHELLNGFKAAALAVTNLYKTAATEQARSRAAGYQDALDELLTLLDRENLGLGVDGEGWRIRQWATERFNGTSGGHSDDEDERDETQQESRQQSPEVQRKQEQQQDPAADVPTEQAEEVRVEAVPIPQHHNSDMFTFRSSLPYPSGNHDRDTDMEPGTIAPDLTSTTSSNTSHSSPLGVNVVPRQRNGRHGHRHASGNRLTSFTATNLGTGAGSKRKMPDFFDISGFGGFGGSFGGNNGGKDSDRFGGGGKRGRHV